MLTTFFQSISGWIARLFGRRSKPEQRYRKTVFVEGDELPETLPAEDLVVAREGDTLWAAGMTCPCGCGRRIEVMLLQGVKPRWDFAVDDLGRPTLHPSVWLANGCRSHFFLRKGVVEWCTDSILAVTATNSRR